MPRVRLPHHRRITRSSPGCLICKLLPVFIVAVMLFAVHYMKILPEEAPRRAARCSRIEAVGSSNGRDVRIPLDVRAEQRRPRRSTTPGRRAL